MYSKKNSPPKRLPSRYASGIPLPPKVPTYRAPLSYSSNRYKNSNNNNNNNNNSNTPRRSTRFLLASQSSPTSMKHQERQKNIINGKNSDGSISRRRPVIEYGGSSPSPRKPQIRRSLDSSVKKEDNLNGIYGNDTETPVQDVYQASLNESNKTSGLNFVGYSVCKDIKVTGIVDVTPRQWRLDIDPLSYCVELQVKNLNPNVYPMRRLCRLIEKKVTHRQNKENKNAFQRSPPRRGSLIINKKDNDHLKFLDNFPNIILLQGSTTLADVIDVNTLPSQSNNDHDNNDSSETVVYFRWIEGPPVELVVDANSVTSKDHESEKNFDYNDNDDVFNVNKPVSTSMNSLAHLENEKSNYIYHDYEKNNYNGNNIVSPLSAVNFIQDENDHNHVEVNKRERNLSSMVVDYSAPTNIPPITYLQGPSILYQDP